MEPRDRIDAFGAISFVAFSALLAFNQVVIKVVNEGLQPVFFAGVRSAGAILCVLAWMNLRRVPIRIAPGTVPAGVLLGTLFAGEFVFMFVALDLTTVTRMAVIFYSMPVWLAIAAHFLLPGERMSRRKAAGHLLAFAGVFWPIVSRGTDSGGSLAGDLCALGAAMCWAGIALCARGTALARVPPEMQLLWQVVVSAPLLLALAPLFGPLVRELQPIHLWGLLFQIVVIVSGGFAFWLWLLSVYPAAGVASFSFLSPIFGVGFGWALLGEKVGPAIVASLALVAAGLLLINRPSRETRRHERSD